jgi:hypothetical protein
MRTFINFLHENQKITSLINNGSEEIALEEIIKVLEKDCKPFIND